MMNTPYLDSLLATIEKQERLVELLNLRIVHLKSDIEAKSNHRIKVENDITIIKTEAEVDALQKVISEKRKYFEEYSIWFEQQCKEMDQKYDKLIESAYLNAKKNPDLKTVLDRVDRKLVKTDREAKLNFYQTVRGILTK